MQDAIEQHLARSGSERISAATARRLVIQTRQDKQPATNADLDREWQIAANGAGFTTHHLDSLRNVSRADPEPPQQLKLLRGLTEFDATFTTARRERSRSSGGGSADRAGARRARPGTR